MPKSSFLLRLPHQGRPLRSILRPPRYPSRLSHPTSIPITVTTTATCSSSSGSSTITTRRSSAFRSLRPCLYHLRAVFFLLVLPARLARRTRGTPRRVRSERRGVAPAERGRAHACRGGAGAVGGAPCKGARGAARSGHRRERERGDRWR